MRIYNCSALTGGGVRALDTISSTALANGDRAFVSDSGSFYVFIYNAASVAAESVPALIRPNDYSTAGVWENQNSPFGNTGITVLSTNPIKNDIRGGDISVSDAANRILSITPISCEDSTSKIPLVTTTTKTLTMGTGNNLLEHIAVVKLNNGTIDFKKYTTLATMAADVGVNITNYRPIDFWQNTGAGAAKKGFSRKGIHWWLAASENVIRASAAVPAGVNTSLDITSFLPDLSMVDSILPGANSATGSQTVIFSLDGVNTFCVCHALNTGISDNDANCWYNDANPAPKFIPIINGILYHGRGAGSAASNTQYLMKAIALSR